MSKYLVENQLEQEITQLGCYLGGLRFKKKWLREHQTIGVTKEIGIIEKEFSMLIKKSDDIFRKKNNLPMKTCDKK